MQTQTSIDFNHSSVGFSRTIAAVFRPLLISHAEKSSAVVPQLIHNTVPHDIERMTIVRFVIVPGLQFTLCNGSQFAEIENGSLRGSQGFHDQGIEIMQCDVLEQNGGNRMNACHPEHADK